MVGGTRLSYQGLKVLRVFLVTLSEDVRAELAGADVMREAGISSGTLYPILLRLERVGVLSSRWEEPAASELGRPRRRFYRLTADGMEFARAALRDLAEPSGAPQLGEA